MIEARRVEGEAAGEAPRDVAMERVGEALEGLRFGTVTVVVQDGVVVQVERTEKLRLVRGR